MKYIFKNNILQKKMNKQRGFSLPELMITLAIAGILSSIALPSLTSTIQDSRIGSQMDAFRFDLNLARSEAIKRGVRVTMCKSSDGENCTASDDWDQGWIVFVESDTENAQRENDELILRQHDALGGNTMSSIGNVNNYISYIDNGFSRTVEGAVQTGSIALCDRRKDNNKGRAIRINATGRALVSRVSETTQSCAI